MWGWGFSKCGELWKKEGTCVALWLGVCQHLLSLDRELMTDQSQDIPQVEFTGVTYRSMGLVLLTGIRMTQKQLHCWEFTPAWVAAPESWDAGTHCRPCRQLYSAQPLPGILTSGSGPVCPHCLYNQGKEKPGSSGQFQGLPEAFELFTFWVLKSFPLELPPPIPWNRF